MRPAIASRLRPPIHIDGRASRARDAAPLALMLLRRLVDRRPIACRTDRGHFVANFRARARR